MQSGVDVSNPVLVAAFRSALVHQGVIALVILAVLATAWAGLRHYRRGQLRSAASAPPSAREPAGRSLLRIGFGVLWILDGILQAQPSMPAGLPSDVIAPAAAGSPQWLLHLVSWAGTAWSLHPVQAGAAAVWIQVGIGVWLLAAGRGPWSRAAGMVSAGWGLVVWVFGEALGSVFAPGLSVLYGAPGAALFYVVAGFLVALPDRSWQSPALGRRVLSVLGLFLIGMAVLQAWPGRGFWQGTVHGHAGSLTAMVSSMARAPQPGVVASWVRAFASVTAADGFWVNLGAVLALAAIGVGLVIQKPWLLRPVLITMTVLGLADWVLIEDFGFFGGVGTDPNSMIPILLLAFCGYLAITHTARRPAARGARAAATPPAGAEPAQAPSQAGSPAVTGRSAATGRTRRPEWLSRERLTVAAASAPWSLVLASWAAVLVVLGAVPMALAQANPNADPIIADALDGPAISLDYAAPGFVLTDQDGRLVPLAGLHGKVVLLVFLDPLGSADSRLIAREVVMADRLLGSRSAAVDLVAVSLNPVHDTTAELMAFDRREGLAGLRNWRFLTGPLPQLREVWLSYHMFAVPSHGVLVHNDLAYVIDATGQVRSELNDDPGPGTGSSESAFAVEFEQAVEHAIGRG
jgi:cytochrome oxidase Cu insertion factor (SCO1/SenC/PrrC family)